MFEVLRYILLSFRNSCQFFLCWFLCCRICCSFHGSRVGTENHNKQANVKGLQHMFVYSRSHGDRIHRYEIRQYLSGVVPSIYISSRPLVLPTIWITPPLQDWHLQTAALPPMLSICLLEVAGHSLCHFFFSAASLYSPHMHQYRVIRRFCQIAHLTSRRTTMTLALTTNAIRELIKYNSDERKQSYYERLICTH